MKTINRYSAIASLLLIVVAMVAACSTKDLEIPSDVEESASGQMLFTATVAAKNPVTKTVNASGETAWAENEKISVYYEKNDNTYGTATANVDAVNGGIASISAELSNAKNGSTVKFVYPAGLMDETNGNLDATKLANQHGTITDISDNFDAATGSGTLKTNTEGTTCGTEGTITMTNQVLIGKFTPQLGGSAIDGITSLTISDGTHSYAVTPSSGTFDDKGIFVAMLPVDDKEMTITAATASKNYYYNKSGISLSASTLYNSLSVNMMVYHDLASAPFTDDADAYIYQSNPGTATSNTITIADGRKVVLAGVNMLASGNVINCLGNAGIVLSGTNTVKSTESADVNKAIIKAGTYEPRTTLKISGDGKLTVETTYNGSHMGALIGSDKNGDCGNITITGGSITANARKYNNGAAYGAIIGAGSSDSGTSRCGDITISGGTVTVDTHKGGGAGIGSGTSENSSGYSTCGTITISGGNVTAQSWEGGAAIGSGRVSIYQQNPTYDGYSRCEGIIIEGTADVTAKSTANSSTSNAYAGSAIGTGSAGQVGDIEIRGGTVKATMTDYGAPGIGAAKFRSTCGNITISGGTVEAKGGEKAAGIGTGRGLYKCLSTCGSITITTGVTSVKATMGNQGSRSIGRAGASNGNPYFCNCGTVTIGGTVYSSGVTDSPYTYTPAQ